MPFNRLATVHVSASVAPEKCHQQVTLYDSGLTLLFTPAE